MSGGAYRLQKRNSSSYSIDGKGSGADGQNVHLWANNDNNQNQHWIFEVVGSSIQSPSNDAFGLSGINTNTKQGKLRYFPSPFDNGLTVELPASQNDQQMEIRLVDIMGRMVFQRANLQSGEQVIVEGAFGSGIYWLQWLDQNGPTATNGKGS